MQGENRSRVPFDDRAALEELERLQRSIQEYRRRREAAEGAFEEFVGSFRTPASQQPAAAPAQRVPPVTAKPASASPVSPQRPAARGLEAFGIAEQPPAAPPAQAAHPISPPAPVAADPVIDVPSSSPAPILLPDTFLASGPAIPTDAVVSTSERPRGRRGTRGLIPLALGGAAILLLAGVLITRSRNAPADPVVAQAPARADTPATAPVAAPPPAPVVAPAEIRTVRTVWVRVIVDGAKQVERELQAGAVVSLPAGRTYVIRAGDAGAVRFLLNGQDQGPLGRDGIAVTRTFPAPAQ
jgi:hypothetical protein